jgi:hypothetical protein
VAKGRSNFLKRMAALSMVPMPSNVSASPGGKAGAVAWGAQARQ